MLHNTTTSFWFTEEVSPFDLYIHGASNVICSLKTPYQKMEIVETPTMGKALILDGKVQSATEDEFLYHESLVHPACLSNGAPKTVLILGGGEGATLREALRWKTIERAVMVDIDRQVVEACRDNLPEMHHGSFSDPRAQLVFSDALEFLESSDVKWDIIISDLTEPLEGGPSFKLFTKECFELARKHLAASGSFVLQAGPVGPQYLKLFARLASTLKTVFQYTLAYSVSVPSYPAPWGFLMGSVTPISPPPNPEETNSLLAEKTIGGFRMLDGQALLGLLHTPLYVRSAINSEKHVFTLQAPPQSFG
jgi:spermidine synthase